MWLEAKPGNYDEWIGIDPTLPEKKVGVSKDFKPALKMNGSLASPVPNWMFNVTFLFNPMAKRRFSINENDVNDSFQCIGADLPGFEGSTKEVFFLGTKKSFVINRDYSGDTTLEFWLRDSAKLDDHPANKTQLLDVLVPKSLTADNFDHYEFFPLFDAILLEVLNQDGSRFKMYKLIHPQVTGIEHGGSLSYEGEEGLKLTVTVHYDMWEQS